jgi:signal transduction histidine kinase
VVNDILDFSKLEAGKITIESIPFDLHGTLKSIMVPFMPAANKKRLGLGCLVEPDVPSAVVGDPVRLRQVLTNLISNAIKFTERGEVKIRAGRQADTACDFILRVSVRDTGIGIPADQLSRVFESFTQADSSTSRKYGGTGLGLTISKDLVTLMGGEIGCESEVGRGSTFWFSVPLGKGPGQRPGSSPAEQGKHPPA